MINEQDKQRIQKEATEYCEGSPHYLFEYRGYIAGATSELERSEKLHKEEEVKAEQNAFHLVKALDLLDECHHYLKSNPPDKSKMTYNKWESLIEETDYMREFNSEAEYERINGSQEYREVIRELIPLAVVGAAYYRQNPGFDWVKEREKSNAKISRAKSLIEPKTDKA